MSLYIFPDTTLLTTVNTWTNLQTFLDVNFELTDNVDLTKIAKFELSGISTATTRTYTLPNITATLAHLGNAAQTFSGSTTFSNPTVTVGNSAATATYGLGVGATSAANTKTINIGTSGVSTSITNINIGSATSDSTTDVYGILEVLAAQTGGLASNGIIKIHGKDFGTTPATITQGAFSLAPWLLINSGSDVNSFVSIQSANSGYTWTFNNAGVLTVPGQIQSSVATGTAPFTVASTTVVTNFNADTVDSYHVGTSGATIPLFNGTNSWSGTQSFLTGLRLNTTTTVDGAYNGTGISLQSHAISAAGAGYTIGMWAATAAAGGALEFIKSRAAGGVIGVAGVVADGDTLGRIVGSGYNSTPSIVRSAEIAFVVSGTPTASSVPSKIEFLTSGTTGTATSRVEIGPTGLLSALNGLTVTGTATLGTSVISLGGNFTTSGAFATTLTATAATSVTLPTSGTLVTTAATAQTLQGNITFSGTNTFSSSNTFSKGATLGASAGPTFKFNLDFASDVANTWRRFIVASLANIQYSTIGFKIRVTDPNANHATQASVTADFETYMVACVRTEATTLDTPDLCVVRGPSNRIRAVKTSTGNYEIQIQNEAQFREYFVEVDCYAINGSHTITYENGSTVGSTGTAQYDASVGASIFFTEKLTAKGSITADAGATFTAGQTVAFNNTTGTAPFTVASTTQVTNLNASQLAGNSIGTSGAAIPLCNGTNTFSGNTTFSNPTVTVGNSAATATYGLGIGATSAANTKTINIGTSGVAGSITNVNIGSVNSTNTISVYGDIQQDYDAPTTAGAPFAGVTHYLEPQAGVTLSSVTVDVSTAVFTCSAVTLVAGQAITLSGTNTGALITGYTNPSIYYVLSTNLTSTTFMLSTTPGGASIALTGTSGSTGLSFTTSTGATAFGTTESPFISGQTFFAGGAVPYLWLSSGGKSNSFVSLSTANNAYAWNFSSTGILTVPGQIQSSVATGTSPFTVASTTVVTNLNADTVDSYHVGTSGATIPLFNGTNSWSGDQTFLNPVKLNSTTAVAGTYNLSTVMLQSHSNTPTAAGCTFGSWNAGVNSSAIEFIKSRTAGAGNPGTVIAGDNLGQIIASGYDATTVTSVLRESSAIRMIVGATPTVGFTPGRIQFFTAGTASASTSRVEIGSTGLLSALNGITVSGATTTLTTGTTTVAPLTFVSGTNLTTAGAGTVEYDGSFFYGTRETTSGRGSLAVYHVFRLGANGTAITTIANFYGTTSALNLAASSVYDIEYHVYFTKTTAGTVTFTLTASSAPTLIFGVLSGTPATGVGAGTPQSLTASSQGATTAAFGATATLTTAVNHVFYIKVRVQTNLSTTFNLQLTSAAGSATPLAGSYYNVKRISATQGSFA